VTVAGELRPVIRSLSHTAALPFLEKKSLHFYWTCIFTFQISLVLNVDATIFSVGSESAVI
jgi:hypothetical protein